MRYYPLTIGTAVYDDFHGLYMTLQSLRLHHPEVIPHIEFVIVDNHPDSPHGAACKDLLGWCPDLRVSYNPLPSPVGTSPARQRIFDVAMGEWVLCVDSHVMFPAGVIHRLLGYLAANPESKDILSGPILWDNVQFGATHFRDEWRAEMWGVWDTDPRGSDPDGDPFEIPGMGLGCFAARKAAWVGFHPQSRGFGGEEMYVHEKVRRAGGKALCLPFLRWLHRFGRPDGIPYAAHLNVWNKARNYVLELRELGLPLDPVYDQFVATNKMPAHEWHQLLAGKDWPEGPGVKEKPIEGCGCDNVGTLEAAYLKAVQVASDINEHVPTLKDLAAGRANVIEFGVRHAVSTVGLLAGQPKRLVSYDLNPSAEAEKLKKIAGQTEFIFKIGDSLSVEPELCDLLFIDTKHTGEHLLAELQRHAPYAQRVALHDTVIFGEVGEDGKPGLLWAIRRFVTDNPQWTVIRFDENNHGFTVLSQREEDKTPLPPLWEQGWSFLTANARLASHGWGAATEEVMTSRLALCQLCPARNGDRCGKCGCPVEKKASYPTEQCPIGKWGRVE